MTPAEKAKVVTECHDLIKLARLKRDALTL